MRLPITLAALAAAVLLAFVPAADSKPHSRTLVSGPVFNVNCGGGETGETGFAIVGTSGYRLKDGRLRLGQIFTQNPCSHPLDLYFGGSNGPGGDPVVVRILPGTFVDLHRRDLNKLGLGNVRFFESEVGFGGTFTVTLPTSDPSPNYP